MAGPGGGRGGGEAAVSSVVGTVLMLGITMAVFAGLAVVVLDRFSEDGAAGTLRADLDVAEQDGRILLLHHGGERLDLDAGRLLLTVDGTDTELGLSALAAQVSDGATWRIGESLCLAGPQPPCHYAQGQVTDLVLVYGDAVAIDGLPGAGAAASAILTYVSSATATVGTVASLPQAQSASDGGAEATFTESATAVPPGTVGPVKLSATTATTGGALAHTNVLASDDQAAQLDTTGDAIEVSGFDLPADAASVTAVSIGYEGRKDSGGGTSPNVRLDYKLGALGTYSLGTSGNGGIETVGNSGTDADHTRTLTGSFSVADVEALTVRAFLVADTNRNPLVDHVFVAVTYTTSASTTHALDVRLDFSGVPATGSHELQLQYRATGDSFLVQVWDGTAYTTRGLALDSATATAWSYVPTASELSGGALRLRLVDATPTGSTQGGLFLDYARVATA